MTKILITGASGLLGSNALFFFRDRLETFGIYLDHPIQIPNTSNSRMDLTHSVDLNKYLKEVQPNVILHTAALTNIDFCESNHQLAHQCNVESTETLARYSKESGALLIYISTDAFFNQSNKRPTEEEQPHPVNFYGKTKLAAEQCIQSLTPEHLIIRTNIYGWNFQNKWSFAEWILFNLSKNQKIPLVQDVFYDPLLVNTLIDIINDLISLKSKGIYHVVSDERISKLDFGYQLCDEFDLNKDLIIPSKIADLRLKAPRANHMALSNQKLKELFPNRVLSISSDLKKFKSLRDSGYVERLKGSVQSDDPSQIENSPI